MSSLVDIADDTPGNLATIEKDLAESVAASNVNNVEAPVAKTPDASKLPEKLRGKSLEDVAEMYINIESAMGRMANDLGTQRKLTDRLLDLKRAEDLGKQAPQAADVKTSDLLERPTETLEKFASQRERSLKDTYDQRIAQLEGSLAQQRFEQKHSDYQTTANDPAFVSWVQKSSFRTKVAQAAYNGDWSAADELLTEYKSIKVTVVPKTDAKSGNTNEDGLKAARAASLDSSGASSDGAGSGKAPGKIYRRADLMQLRISKPDQYYDEGFQAEILLAHSQGRVK